jgi:hypothetical protein
MQEAVARLGKRAAWLLAQLVCFKEGWLHSCPVGMQAHQKGAKIRFWWGKEQSN